MHRFGKELPTLLAIYSLCGYFMIFVCLSLGYWGLDVNLIVSVPGFSSLLFYIICGNRPPFKAA